MPVNEHRRTNSAYSGRTDDNPALVARKEFSLASGSTSADHSIGLPGHLQSRDRQTFERLPSNGPIVERTVSGSSVTRPGKRCASAGTTPQNPSPQSYCDRTGDIKHPAPRCDSLEYAQHGEGTRSQSIYGMPHMEAVQSEAPFSQEVQTQPRQTIHREALRYRRLVSEPARQSIGPVRRREEPDSGTRTYSTGTSSAPGHSLTSDTRLSAPWHDDSIRGPEYAGWHGDRALYAPASASGIHPVSATDQYQDADRSGSTPDHRQLWNAQASKSPAVVESPSTVSPSFHADVLLLAEHDRNLVLWYHLQENPPRLLQKCQRTYYRHTKLYRFAQPESENIRLDGFG